MTQMEFQGVRVVALVLVLAGQEMAVLVIPLLNLHRKVTLVETLFPMHHFHFFLVAVGVLMRLAILVQSPLPALVVLAQHLLFLVQVLRPSTLAAAVEQAGGRVQLAQQAVLVVVAQVGINLEMGLTEELTQVEVEVAAVVVAHPTKPLAQAALALSSSSTK